MKPLFMVQVVVLFFFEMDIFFTDISQTMTEHFLRDFYHFKNLMLQTKFKKLFLMKFLSEGLKIY